MEEHTTRQAALELTTTLHYTTLHYTTLHYTTQRHATARYGTLRHITGQDRTAQHTEMVFHTKTGSPHQQGLTINTMMRMTFTKGPPLAGAPAPAPATGVSTAGDARGTASASRWLWALRDGLRREAMRRTLLWEPEWPLMAAAA